MTKCIHCGTELIHGGDHDGDDEDDYDNYESYQLDAKKYSAPAKVNNKKEFNIDNI